VESGTGKKAIFDLGIAKDCEVYPPVIKRAIEETYHVINAEKDVQGILVDEGVPLESINSIIWR
jgi:hypothetical protein